MTCCAKRPLVMVYVAVLSYFSVAFMGLATLPAYLQGVVIRDNPGASTEQVAAIYGNRFLVFTLLQGSLSVLVAGWAGRLSDRFGRRRCASLPAIGQAVGTGILAAAAYFQLDWRIALAGWAITGVLGGPYVFLAAAFAYIADWTTAEGRGRAFAGLEGVMLYVSAVGPLMAGPLLQLWGSLAASEDDRDSVGFAGLWGMCAIVYAVPAFCFALAQPSPQVLTPPAPCGRWVATSTPVLVARLLCEGRGGLNRLCLAFLLSLSSSMGGVQAFLLYAQSFLGWKEAKIGVFVAAFSGVTGSLILLSTLLLPRLLARCGRAPPHDLTMVRGAYLGPPLYLLALFLAPADACEHIALWGMPLLGLGACALPHFRALFSTARPAERQGETMALVAALESVPQMVASPLAALAFTHLLQTPQLIFIACMAPVLLALLLLSTLRRATLQRADDALPADPRRSLLLDGAGESLPVAPTPAVAQVVPASTRHLSFAE